MNILPWEISNEICRMACTSLPNILCMRSVCKEWADIANKIHKERIEELYIGFCGPERKEFLSRLISISFYRPEKVREICNEQRNSMIIMDFNAYLEQHFPEFHLNDYDVFIGFSESHAGVNVYDGTHWIDSDSYLELLGVSEKEFYCLENVFTSIKRKYPQFIIYN